jgi:hypothetical protein
MLVCVFDAIEAYYEDLELKNQDLKNLLLGLIIEQEATDEEKKLAEEESHGNTIDGGRGPLEKDLKINWLFRRSFMTMRILSRLHGFIGYIITDRPEDPSLPYNYPYYSILKLADGILEARTKPDKKNLEIKQLILSIIDAQEKKSAAEDFKPTIMSRRLLSRWYSFIDYLIANKDEIIHYTKACASYRG